MMDYSFQYARRRAHIPAAENPFKYKYAQEQDTFMAQGAWDVVYAPEDGLWSAWPLTEEGEKALGIGYVSKHVLMGGRFRARPETDAYFVGKKILLISEITLDQLNILRKTRPWI